MDELVRCLRHCVDAPEHRACGANCKYGKEHPVNYLCIPVMMQEAADAIEQLNADLERSKEWETFWEKEANEALKKFQTAVANKPRWIPVEERLPEDGAHVLLSCKCGAGAYVCDGFHTEKYSTPTQFYEDIDADYDEDTDEYYFPEGWWEVVKNWDDFSCVAIEDTVTHWLPLPEPPTAEEGE